MLRPVSPDFPEAQTIIVFSTPENQSTQQLRLRRTGPRRTLRRTGKPGDNETINQLRKHLTNMRSHFHAGTADDPVNSIE